MEFPRASAHPLPGQTQLKTAVILYPFFVLSFRELYTNLSWSPTYGAVLVAVVVALFSSAGEKIGSCAGA